MLDFFELFYDPIILLVFRYGIREIIIVLSRIQLSNAFERLAF